MKKRSISAERSKRAILRAALEEFARRGISGARTDAIANAAGVNIALVFYYFKNKDKLYLTVLEEIFAEMHRRVLAALDCCTTNRERILAYVQTHFDFLAEAPSRPRLVMQEYARGASPAGTQVAKLLKKYIRPVHDRVTEVLKDGIETGEFRDVDVKHFQFSISGLTTMYFISSEKIQQLTGIDPLSSEQLTKRRKTVAAFVSAALFTPAASATKATRRSRKVF
jgi:TetR/AcrR family transcriptional regulator